MKRILVILMAVFTLSACGGGSGGDGKTEISDEMPAETNVTCVGTITGDDTGSFEMNYFFETDIFTLSVNTQNIGQVQFSGEMYYENGKYVYTAVEQTGTVIYKEADSTIKGTWRNTHDGAKGALEGTCTVTN